MLVYPLTRSAHVAAHRAAAQQFNRAFERLFDEAFDRTPRDATRTPAIDVVETDAAYRIAFEVPGVAREQLKATIEGRRLVLETIEPAAAAPVADGDDKAGMATEVAVDKAAVPAERTLYRERSTPRYARTVVLPVEVDASSAEARLENGILTLMLAKKVKAGAVQIQVA